MNQLFNRKSAPTLLGLALEGGKIEGVLLHRTNGSIEVVKRFSAALTLDLLNNEPELVGREIRNHLDAAGIRERRCVVCIPLKWVLTLGTALPEIPDADVPEFLQIEAERGFSVGVEELLIGSMCYRTGTSGRSATQVAVPRNHVTRLEQALGAAQLKPVSFGLGIMALQPAGGEAAPGVLALAVGEEGVDLQVTTGGGVAALRALEGAFEAAGGEKEIDTDFIAREVRITLGQLPAEVREKVRQLHIFGQGAFARQLADEITPAARAMGLGVEQVTAFQSGDLGVQLPAGTPASPALNLAARQLAGRPPIMEFLPPKVSAWQQISSRYSSKKLLWTGSTAGAIVLIVIGMFAFQQWQLAYYGGQWAGMEPKVRELEDMEQQIRKYRPWFDDGLTTMTILKRLTEAFPENGSVTAKTVEIRGLSSITCSGTARDTASLIKTTVNLRSVKEVNGVQIESTKGKSPVQFTFSFRWGKGGQP